MNVEVLASTRTSRGSDDEDGDRLKESSTSNTIRGKSDSIMPCESYDGTISNSVSPKKSSKPKNKKTLYSISEHDYILESSRTPTLISATPQACQTGKSLLQLTTSTCTQTNKSQEMDGENHDEEDINANICSDNQTYSFILKEITAACKRLPRKSENSTTAHLVNDEGTSKSLKGQANSVEDERNVNILTGDVNNLMQAGKGSPKNNNNKSFTVLHPVFRSDETEIVEINKEKSGGFASGAEVSVAEGLEMGDEKDVDTTRSSVQQILSGIGFDDQTYSLILKELITACKNLPRKTVNNSKAENLTTGENDLGYECTSSMKNEGDLVEGEINANILLTSSKDINKNLKSRSSIPENQISKKFTELDSEIEGEFDAKLVGTEIDKEILGESAAPTEETEENFLADTVITITEFDPNESVNKPIFSDLLYWKSKMLSLNDIMGENGEEKIKSASQVGNTTCDPQIETSCQVGPSLHTMSSSPKTNTPDKEFLNAAAGDQNDQYQPYIEASLLREGLEDIVETFQEGFEGAVNIFSNAVSLIVGSDDDDEDQKDEDSDPDAIYGNYEIILDVEDDIYYEAPENLAHNHDSDPFQESQ